MKESWKERRKPTSVEMKSLAVHQEVPNEEAEVETIKALENQYRDWFLAVGHRRQPNKQI
jgi:hypothetical protein